MLVSPTGTRTGWNSPGATRATDSLVVLPLERRLERRKLPGTGVRSAPAAAGDPQARLRARATPGGSGVQGPQVRGPGSAAPEALQDRLHQGAHSTATDRTGDTGSAPARRGEDVDLRPGEETRGATRRRDPDPGTHTAKQARGLLHPVQDPGELTPPPPS